MPYQAEINEQDVRRLLYEFNDTKAEYPRDKVLQGMFEDQVERTPNNLAVISKDKKLNYRELNERSNQLARALRRRGVGPDQIVGLMVQDNSIEMVTGMIGILKAGGAFLPIDAEFPRERIEYMIEDSNMRILLTGGKLGDGIGLKGEIINLEDDSLFTGECSNLDQINQSKNLVYVIYTSGSTGNPKGVQIEHTSIVNQIFGLEKMYNFDCSLNHILLAPITFDPSVQQIFLPLTSGGKLFLISKSTKQNIKELWEFIVSNRIDILNTVPSLMNVLLENVNSYNSLHFKYVILAGEVFSTNLHVRLKETLSSEKIINIYGPTEATINTTLYECKTDEINGTIPIGKPLMNYTVLILDENQNLVPMGAEGEICISGVGLARGYVNNPELTAEKFVPNPFISGERIYRTGDLGRWTADGNIEFLGRMDDQVKVRGIRVELGEVEKTLNQHPGVRENVVIKKGEDEGNARLVAYVVMNEGATLTVDGVRGFMKEKVPEYMVPSAFVIIESLPLTSHGKVDRRALLELESVRQETEDSFVAPRDELESQLTAIWENILGVKHIGVKDDFFGLGGTSLLGMVLLAEIERLTGRNFPLATLLNASTIEHLVSIIRKSRDECSAPWSSLVPIQAGLSKPPIFFVHGADGNILIYRDLARRLGPDQPVYGLQSQINGMEQPFCTKVEEMASHFLKEILAFQPEGPYLLGGYCLGGSIAYEIAQQLNAQGKEVALLALMETYNFSNIKPRSYLDNAYYNMQRLNFHLRNFFLLNNREKLTFIKEKAIVAKRRRNVWLGMIMMKISSQVALNNKQASLLYNLWKINDQAAGDYKPKVYPGKIIEFKPKKEYSHLIGPELGWNDLAAGGVETHILPVFPTGMLIEPFVKLTAEKMKICIQKALDGRVDKLIMLKPVQILYLRE